MYASAGFRSGCLDREAHGERFPEDPYGDKAAASGRGPLPFKARLFGDGHAANGSCRLSCVKDEARGRSQEAPAGVTLDRMLRETEKVYEEVVGDGG